MRSMRSMRGGFISRSRGPLQKVCHGPARMSGHDCLPGPQTVCFPGGRPHEQNEEVPRIDGSACSGRSQALEPMPSGSGHSDLKPTVLAWTTE
jgi:hypothetical protein